jgi:hypothetical protein
MVSLVLSDYEQRYFSARASFCHQRDDPHNVYDLHVDHLRSHDAWKVSLAEECLMDLMVLGAAYSTRSFYKNERDLLQNNRSGDSLGWLEQNKTHLRAGEGYLSNENKCCIKEWILAEALEDPHEWSV